MSELKFPGKTTSADITPVDIDGASLVVNDSYKLSETESGLSSALASETQGLTGEKEAKKQGCWRRHRERMRTSRKWCIGTWLLVALVISLILIAILVPVLHVVVIPSIANSSVASAKLSIDEVNLGTEDLAQSTIGTRMRGSITGMPSIMRIRTGQATAMLSNGNGTIFATTDLPVLDGKDGRMDVNIDSVMRLLNRTAFDTMASNMINNGQPGIIRMQAKNVPVTVWLGAIKIVVYGGVDIDQTIIMDAIAGLNQVNVSDTVTLKEATPSDLTINMGVNLPNPSSTTVFAQNGLVLDLLSAKNETIGRVELPSFQLARGNNDILANAIIEYTDPNAAGTMPAIVRRRVSNTNAVRSFLSSYMGGTGIVLRLKGPDTNSMPEATYVQRALANWTTVIELATPVSASFVTGTKVADVKPFQELGQVIIMAEVSATNPFDLPVTVKNVLIQLSMNGEQVGVINLLDAGQIPGKGNVTLTDLSTKIDIGKFVGGVVTDAFDWLGSVISGKGTFDVGALELRGYIDIRVDGQFPIYLPIHSDNVPLANLTNPDALMPTG